MTIKAQVICEPRGDHGLEGAGLDLGNTLEFEDMNDGKYYRLRFNDSFNNEVHTYYVKKNIFGRYFKKTKQNK